MPVHASLAPEGDSFQQQTDPLQNRGTFLQTVISETSPRIISQKYIFLESVTFQFHARMLSSQLVKSLISYGHLSDLEVEIALDHRHVEFFG